MAVMLRLARHGKKSQPFYRIVATDKENKRDGKYIELVGTYNPKTNPPISTLKEDLIKKWIGVGAKPSKVVENLIKKSFPGMIEDRQKHKLAKIKERRQARKKRAKSKSKGK